MDERKVLEDFGCKEIKYDSLVNNYYIKFTYNKKEYTIEHILNVYGAEVDMWELCGSARETFSTLEELLNHIKREEKKMEALERMKLLKLNSQCIKAFEEENIVWESEGFGALYECNETERKIIKEFEESTGGLVYHMIHNVYKEIGECYSIFYVSKEESEWELDRYDIKAYYPFVYVKNITDEWCSEFGQIGIRPSFGGLVREC